MVDFSFARIANFPIPDLQSENLVSEVAELEVSRRRERLFAQSQKSSLEWLDHVATYFFETGVYSESDNYAGRLGLAAKQEESERYLAKAIHWQSVCALARSRNDRLRDRIEALDHLSRESEDQTVLAIQQFIHALSLEKVTPRDFKFGHLVGDNWTDIFKSYRSASNTFLELGDIDLSILCMIEYAYSKSNLGEYITAISWIEKALDRARTHGAWKFTGRMLITAASAASDQGYRIGVEETMQKAATWCQFVGDEWGRIEALTGIGRLLSYEIPVGTPQAIPASEGYLKQALDAAEELGVPWLITRARNALKFLYHKAGMPLEQMQYSGTKPPPLESTDEEIDQDARRRIASRLADGINDSPSPFFVFSALRDEDLVCRDFINEYRNDAGSRITGKQIGYVSLLSELSNNAYFKGIHEAIFQAAETRATFENVWEIEEDNRRLWFTRKVVPSGDGVVVSFRNITAEREIEESLRKAADSALKSERTMSEFLANMSHEIRTPINGVLGLARMLNETQLDEVQKGYVRDIIGSGDILFGLIGDILDMSKLEAGFLEIVPEPTDIRSLVAGISGLYRGQAAAKGITISSFVHDNVPKTLMADGVRLRQILANITGNAVKFTDQGTIEIFVLQDNDETVFEISDTGQGVSDEQIDFIFDRFQQASRSLSHQSGTGLGLTIAKRLTTLMDGNIHVRSRVGKGTCFVVRLPLKEVVIPVKSESEIIPERFIGLKVLLVEDNEINMIVSKHYLTMLGCDVYCVVNGREAVDAYSNHGFDLIFMDVRMPVLDGLAATEEIRAMERETKNHIPIIALTAGAMSDERDRCFEIGMDDYISKPFTNDGLRTVIAKWLPERLKSKA